jgi:DNA repair protein RadC
MAINQWQEEDRPRERLFTHGARKLSDAELLAITLRTGTQGKNAVELARELLQEFGSLRHLLNAEQHQLTHINGFGPVKFAQFKAIAELGQRYARETLQRGDTLTSPEQTEKYLLARMRDHPQEVFACLWLDNRHRIIHFDELFFGTINGANVYSREVVRAALRHNAAATILCHNHPSGVAEPSAADRQITQRLKQALELIDVTVLDHIIVGDQACTSLAREGLI